MNITKLDGCADISFMSRFGVFDDSNHLVAVFADEGTANKFLHQPETIRSLEGQIKALQQEFRGFKEGVTMTAEALTRYIR